MSEQAIIAEHLSKTYQLGVRHSATLSHSLGSLFGKKQSAQEFLALNDISFEINRGDSLAIIGHNGAGKSVLLKILSRITYPSKGRFTINGKVSSLLEVGTGFHYELSGRENVFLNGTILGMSRTEIRQKFDDIVAFSGVEQFIDTPVKHYSSGMKVRLAFAVAAFLDPEILIVDEVLAVGDADFQKRCLNKMETLAKSGRTILFVSHNMAAVRNMCNKAILLERGNMIVQGDVNKVINQYLKRSSDNAAIDLSARLDRGGNGKVRYQSIELRNDADEPIDFSLCGMSLNIHLSYLASEPLNNAVFIIQILNQQGEIITTFNNYLTEGPFFEISAGLNQLRCRIPKLPLPPGEYSINLQSIVNLDWADDIENVFKLEVNEGDFFGSGKLSEQGDIVLVEHHWSKR
jgi:lipopolysaccharide transport system ATP-binding protein